MYGGAAAILLSALEGIAVTLIISKKPRDIPLQLCDSRHRHIFYVDSFESGVWSTSDVLSPTTFQQEFFYAILVMGFVQYIANTVLIAIEKTSKIKESTWHTWRTYYLWTSVTYFAGASAAGIIAILIDHLWVLCGCCDCSDHSHHLFHLSDLSQEHRSFTGTN